MAFIGLSSCSKDLSPAEQFEQDTKLIEEYLQSNNKKAQKTPEGVYYIVEKEGSAEKHPFHCTGLLQGGRLAFPSLEKVVKGFC